MQGAGAFVPRVPGYGIRQEDIREEGPLLQDIQIRILLTMPHTNLRDTLWHCNLLETLCYAL